MADWDLRDDEGDTEPSGAGWLATAKPPFNAAPGSFLFVTTVFRSVPGCGAAGRGAEISPSSAERLLEERGRLENLYESDVWREHGVKFDKFRDLLIIGN